jgi:hypothetical protein
MICQQFEKLAQQIAHNDLRDAKLLRDATSHAASCAACNAILIEARELAASVASLAAHDKSLEAPAHLETALRAAFLREHAANIVSRTDVVAGAGLKRTRFATWTWGALSLAGAAIILAVLLLPRVFHRNSGSEVAGKTPSQPSSPAAASAKAAPAKPVPPTVVQESLAASRRPKKNLSQPEKTLTGFLPLPYADDFSTIEYGAIVRMQMTRADLAWLGLPVPISDTGEKVVADLFVNGSGTPEAIRLVR